MRRTQPGPRKGRSPTEDTPTGTWRGRLRLWIDVAGRGSIGPGKLRLLEAIGTAKSLSGAARQLGMSYRLAWKHLQLIEQRTGWPVVEPQRGGKHGGGTVLTPQGRALLNSYRQFRREVEEAAREAFERHMAGWSDSRPGEPPSQSR